MKVAVGSDHAGLPAKQRVLLLLEELGHETDDVGTHSEASCDYPDFAAEVARRVVDKEADLGVLCCGTGIGMAIAANKVPGVRACLCHDTYSAHQGVEHDDMNILCLGARVIGVEMAVEVATAFLQTTFSGEERHRRRLEKVLAIERKANRGTL